MRRFPAVSAAVLSLLLASGCDATIASGLDEEQANRILVLLDSSGIGADKDRIAAGGEDIRWEVRVANHDVGRALSAMRAADLPRTREPGIQEVFGEGSLVPTATEERARYAAALAGELARSIEAIEGVLDARVHVAIPEARDFALDDEPPRPRASVLIKHRVGDAPHDRAAIQALIAGAVHGMQAEDVAVVAVPGAPPPEGVASIVRVGPISVTEGSSFALKIVLGVAFALNLVLAVSLILLWMRRRRPLAVVAGEAG